MPGKITGFFTINTDIRQIRYIEQQVNVSVSFTNARRRLAFGPTTTPSGGLINTSDNGLTIPSLYSGGNNSVSFNDVIAIVFPQGFTFLHHAVYFQGLKLPNTYVIFADNLGWATLVIEEPYPKVFLNTKDVTIIGIYAPTGSKNYTIQSLAHTKFDSAACTIDSATAPSYILTVNPSPFTTVMVYPTTINAKGADNPVVEMGVKLRTAYEIPSGGSIAVLFNNSDWIVLSDITYCTVVGATNAQCTTSSTEARVSGFDAIKALSVVSIYIYNIVSPTHSPNTINFVNYIRSYNASNEVISEYDGAIGTDDDIQVL